MHDIMRFPSEKNKQKGNRDMGGDAELPVKPNTGQLGTGERRWKQEPPCCCPGLQCRSRSRSRSRQEPGQTIPTSSFFLALQQLMAHAGSDSLTHTHYISDG